MLLVEGIRMIAQRLSDQQSENCGNGALSTAAGYMLNALRAGSMRSRGRRVDTGQRERLRAADWQDLKPEVRNNRLVPLRRSASNIWQGYIVEIAVATADVGALIATLPDCLKLVPVKKSKASSTAYESTVHRMKGTA